MYSNLKNVQYLVAGLKSYHIRRIVISPGNSHNAIVRSLEEDDYFTTYNIVDERSAAFFACGLSQELQETIAICCTAGTAASNYLTGITEASRRGIPIVVITGDKNPYYLAQYEDQMVENMSIFDHVVKHSCRLPIIETAKDAWYCQRIVNETLLEINHFGFGPVHIDVPIDEGMLAIDDSFTTTSLPVFHKIDRFSLKNVNSLLEVFNSIGNRKIFVMCGQDDHISEREKILIERISKKFNIVFGTDKLSNLHCKGTVEVSRVVKALNQKRNEIMPDIIVSIAGNPCMDYKFQFKDGNSNIEHWIVNDEGRVADPFKRLRLVFEGNTIEFLSALDSSRNIEVENKYLSLWQEKYDSIIIPEFEYSNLYAVQRVMKRMPDDCIFNIGNSTTIRIAQYFDLKDSIQVYCNRGVNGIDGCVSTFIGQAAASRKLNFMIVGDLTFFYDMNSLWNRYVGNNVRIMLNNNEGAALFHFNQGGSYPTLNDNVAAEHFATARGWVESQGFKYLSATNKEEFDANLEEFMNENSEKPIFFEVFTQKETDAKLQHEFYDSITERVYTYEAKQGVKKMMKTVMGGNILNRLK